MTQMPTLFVGHGTPMNAIENNSFSKEWQYFGKKLPTPKAILAISAHWYTQGTCTQSAQKPTTIYDMYGFPKTLYDVRYPVNGYMPLTNWLEANLHPTPTINNEWGIDHGTWSVLKHMYPKANIPVVQLSINGNSSIANYFELGKQLAPLRQEGILILGSGNVVHNLQLTDMSLEGGFPWAYEFDAFIKNNVIKQNYDDIIDYKKAGTSAEKAFFTPEHFAPLLYILGATKNFEKCTIFNEKCVMGALSMTSYLFDFENV